ncbi:tRNA (cytidine(34)-2'-O)-methyltransferase [Mycoplasmopsis meleagridis]|uniref:Putative tRNA (cytidine(34)-2'-O)-methyltransferase n=1 Tax=Mycoplasmopsis meleagridis ATCC 25294 TaxID=1264554 RepID=A0A0F5H128_9BACT|nr:tRNA (cytidine(34)-2'-O)-methyltransferase [Mycoplasmopsis meleagridis]KKB26913.1 tRNA (cytosine34-2'-O-)-methyltransferase [Mycoplasmopsis meleagridis ATCC 25294]KUH47455.1 RNA methyltransferase [Mycoplasmopsis meleagridis]OAD18501.1 tRNA (cytidine(34)-2'-O)-methyltransferase [Mycoplasmopsis meleagridis]VEU77629.1 TrmH family RNA methyltransferase [Mycoplasmopsis meleagridis]
MLNIVLFEPEISPNTGNIIRTAFALNAKLHIIKPIAFDLDPKYLSRPAAGRLLSDIPHEIHASYKDFYNLYGKKNIYYLTRYGLKNYAQIDYKKELLEKNEIWIMFGKESTGIDKEILIKNLNNCLRIPMVDKMRSINLANTVAIVGYEIMRQLDFKELSLFETQKGKNYLEELKKNGE